MARHYTAEEAAKRLGVSRNTLYAYVSRGLIRSEPDSRERRTRRYHAQDVERLADSSQVYKAPHAALKKTMDWGEPVLDSAITLIGDEDFYYRGESVLALAERGSFEEAISLLWGMPGSQPEQADTPLRNLIEDCLTLTSGNQGPIEKFLEILLALNVRDVKAFGFAQSTTVRAGAIMLDGFLRLVTGRWRTGTIAEDLAGYWQIEETYRDLIDAVLTLVADHELNISAFVARCAASAGCSPYASVAAATHTFFGRRHGGNTERIAGLLGEADGQGSLYAVIASRIRRGDSVPGFGHRLYDVDPRAHYLLSRLPDQSGYIKEAMSASEDLLSGQYPTVDFALLLLERGLTLPRGAGVHLFYLGRLAGWIAHIMEQYHLEKPIRPRARYVGDREKNCLFDETGPVKQLKS